ncbi:MAG: glycosyltransferase family 2 protein [Victivallaceae bacterium]|nr:glycosyltransferase [Victivallaceae bacterium]
MVSVIIRSHNDEAVIRRTLEMLSRQRNVEYELLSFDDHSTDATLRIIREFSQIKIVPPEDLPYNPSRVLNRAVSFASGDLVVFNNSDAVPLSEDYLERLIAPLSDPGVGAVFGNQLCRPDAKLLVRKDYERAFGDGSVSASWRHFFSMVSSGARRETLLAEPFDPEMQYSEDAEWSWRLKKRGLRIVYVSEAMVQHSHNYNFRQLYRRFYNEGRADVQIFGDAPGFGVALRQFAAEVARDVVYEWRHGRPWLFFSGLTYRAVQKFSAWRGGADMRKGAAGK